MAAESKGGMCNGPHSRNCSPEEILRQGAESDPRARRHLVSGHAGRVSRHHGQQRLRQIDAAQLHRDRHRADRRRRRAAWQVRHDAVRKSAGRLPRQGDRLSVSELRAHRQPHRAGEHPPAAGAARCVRGREPRAADKACGLSGSDGRARQVPGADVRRTKAAHRSGARTHSRPRDRAGRRADRRARLETPVRSWKSSPA